MTPTPIYYDPRPADASAPRVALPWTLSLQALTAAGAAVLAGCVGGDPGDVRHRLYASDYKRVEGGTVYVVLRHEGPWRDAAHAHRIGLIKFATTPEPAVVDARYVWGKPVDEDAYVCYDALNNRVVRRTDYVERIELTGDRENRPVLAFADAAGRVEVVGPSGDVVVPAAAGYTGVTLAAADDRPRLELEKADRWTRLALDGRPLDLPGVGGGAVVTRLD